MHRSLRDRLPAFRGLLVFIAAMVLLRGLPVLEVPHWHGTVQHTHTYGGISHDHGHVTPVPKAEPHHHDHPHPHPHTHDDDGHSHEHHEPAETPPTDHAALQYHHESGHVPDDHNPDQPRRDSTSLFSPYGAPVIAIADSATILPSFGATPPD